MKNKNVLGQNVKAVDSPISYKFDKINNKNKNSLYNIRIFLPCFIVLTSTFADEVISLFSIFNKLSILRLLFLR